MDIAGYSAMMQSDESKAMRWVQTFRAHTEQLTPKYHGTIVQFYGDGCLLTFESASQAVSCTIELQQIFIAHEIPVRIGLHLGEVVFSGENVFGDGVNVASRVESAGKPGSLLLSKSVRDQIKNKTEYSLVSLGHYAFKNIVEPMEVFAITNHGFTVPSKGDPVKGRRLSPNKNHILWPVISVIAGLAAIALYAFWPSPSAQEDEPHIIAVLPFSHESPNQDDEFFTSGIHTDVLTRLASVKDFRIISKSTVREYKDYTGDLSELGSRLNAAYILEGGVRRWEDQVRITAQLVDCETNQAIWSQEYNEAMDNIFELQSKIATEISTQLQANLSATEIDQIGQAPTTVMAAYDDYLKAMHILGKPRPNYDDILEVIRLLNRAVQADSKFGKAWAGLVQAYSEQFAQLSRVGGRDEERAEAKEKVEYALEMAKKVAPEGWEVLQEQAFYEKQVNKDALLALKLFEKAVERNPSDVFSIFQLSQIYTRLGDQNRAIEMLERAFALTQDNGKISYLLTYAYEMSGRYSDMLPLLNRLYELFPEEKHYLVEAKYYQFLYDGTLASYHDFEETLTRTQASNPWDERSIQNKEMVVAMFNNEFDRYHANWMGKSSGHIRSHGNWVCPLIANDHANHVRLLYKNHHHHEADTLLHELQNIVLRPVNLNSICVFNAEVYLPKLDFLAGDSLGARTKLEDIALDVIKNPHFPTGAVERSVLVQAADLIAPDKVYSYYIKAIKNAQSITSFESICADPWTYPNLIQDPQFVAEIKEDGRFVAFLEEFGFLEG